MGKARELWRPAETIETPQCEAVRTSPYANDKPDTDRQCKWSSRYIVGGRYLCSKHAGQEALRILLRAPEEPSDW